VRLSQKTARQGRKFHPKSGGIPTFFSLPSPLSPPSLPFPFPGKIPITVTVKVRDRVRNRVRVRFRVRDTVSNRVRVRVRVRFRVRDRVRWSRYFLVIRPKVGVRYPPLQKVGGGTRNPVPS